MPKSFELLFNALYHDPCLSILVVNPPQTSFCVKMSDHVFHFIGFTCTRHIQRWRDVGGITLQIGRWRWVNTHSSSNRLTSRLGVCKRDAWKWEIEKCCIHDVTCCPFGIYSTQPYTRGLGFHLVIVCYAVKLCWNIVCCVVIKILEFYNACISCTLYGL